MASPETNNPQQLSLPPDIHELLDHSLQPFNDLKGGSQKFTIDNHPDLFVRYNPSHNDWYSTQNILGAAEILHRKTGINVVRSQEVERGGEFFIVSQRVDGVPLDEALSGNPTDELLDEVDSTFGKLCDYLAECRENGESTVVADVYGADQFMLGTTAGDTTPQIYFVDIGDDIVDYSDAAGYADEVLFAADAIVDIENTTGKDMPIARGRIETAISLIPEAPEDPWVQKTANAARYALKNRVRFFPGSEEIDAIPIE